MPDLAYCVFGNIEAVGLDAAVPKRLYEKTFRAADVEYRPGIQQPNNFVRYVSEELQPMRVFAGVHARTYVSVGVIVLRTILRGWRSRSQAGGGRIIPIDDMVIHK